MHETYGIGRFTGIESLTVDDKTRDYLTVVYQGGDKLFLPTDQLDMVQKYIGGEGRGPETFEAWRRGMAESRQ